MEERIYLKTHSELEPVISFKISELRELDVLELALKRLKWVNVDKSRFFLRHSSGRLFRKGGDLPHTGWLTLNYRLVGGKGGLGNQLKAAGGKMAGQKSTNFDECRDLSGRRLKSQRRAEALAAEKEESENRERTRQKALEKKISRLSEPRVKKRIKFDKDEFDKRQSDALSKTRNAVNQALSSASYRRTQSAEQGEVFETSLFGHVIFNPLQAGGNPKPEKGKAKVSSPPKLGGNVQNDSRNGGRRSQRLASTRL